MNLCAKSYSEHKNNSLNTLILFYYIQGNEKNLSLQSVIQNTKLNMNVVRFELIELPYPTLARFGLTQEMIEDLPMRVLDEICDGRHSPVLPVRVRDEKGELIESRSRFALVRRDDGLSDVVFYPVLESSPLERYDEAQQKQLLAGKAILADVETADGRHSKAFVQIDEETKQVMYIPTPIIGRNLQVLADIMHLGTMEVNSMQNGEPLTLVVDDEPVTVGIDLHDKTGIRFCSGDSQKWKEQPKREWDKYTFGVYGCWVMDDDGNLDYVPEEEYTEELWNEQKKSAERNRAAGVHK